MVARVLGARGAVSAPDYRLSSLMPPTIGGVNVAAELIADAIDSGQRILVVGDFDADGATGVALAVTALRLLGAAEVDWLVPDRFGHGYGLSVGLVDEITRMPDLLITVDQGISSVAGVERARQRGSRVLITDHHLPGEHLPAADAIVNPNLPNDPFPSRNLAGVGVVFYTLLATRSVLRQRGRFTARTQPRLDSVLDLVALGTIADLVPLDENNRRLVYQGLRRIHAGRCCPGVRALLDVSGKPPDQVQAADLAFAVAPRLNAAGRLDDMGVGIRCLLSTDEKEAAELAATLDGLNSERRAIQSEMQDLAERQAEQVLERIKTRPRGLCLYDASWHQGVVGLVAGRLTERMHCPVVALAPAKDGGDELKGSARSPAHVHMRDLLVAIDHARPGLIERFGGHARAAGLSIRLEHFAAFRLAFHAAVASHEPVAEQVLSDGPLAAEELSLETARALREAGPWGQQWPEPLFDGRFRVVERRVVGQRHLKLRLQALESTRQFDAIAFQADAWMQRSLPDPVHLTFRLDINRWRGQVSLQLIVEHLVRSVVDQNKVN